MVLGELDDDDARRAGYVFGLSEARAAWERAHGRWRPDEEAWCVTFALGNYSSFISKHRERYLRIGGGITTDPDLALREAGTVPSQEEMRFAAAAAWKREAAAHKALEAMLAAIEANVREMRAHKASLPQEAQQDLQWLERRAARMRKRLERPAA